MLKCEEQAAPAVAPGVELEEQSSLVGAREELAHWTAKKVEVECALHKLEKKVERGRRMLATHTPASASKSIPWDVREVGAYRKVVADVVAAKDAQLKGVQEVHEHALNSNTFSHLQRELGLLEWIVARCESDVHVAELELKIAKLRLESD